MLINNISQHPLWLGVGVGRERSWGQTCPPQCIRVDSSRQKKNDLHVNSDQKQVCTLKLSSLATNLTRKWAIAKLDLN